eukprot:g82898.t1
MKAMPGHVRILLEYGANVNQQNSQQRSTVPIFVASKHGYSNIVGLLARSGANVLYEDENGVSPFYIAAEGGHLPVLEEWMSICVLPGLEWRVNGSISPVYVFHVNKVCRQICLVDDWVHSWLCAI